MFRKMRRQGQQLSVEECEELLRAAPRGVLATLGDDGYPYAKRAALRKLGQKYFP